MISTKGRYALRILVELAETESSGNVAMKVLAAHQGISLKYLERIIPALSAAGLIEAVRGAKGGYRLLKDPKDLTVYEILELTENDMAAVACLSKKAKPCDFKDECRTVAMWEGYQKLTEEYFSKITLADLCRK